MKLSEQQWHWVETGQSLGYPSCCIRMFIMTPLAEDRDWPNPWEGTGYVPCPACAVKPMMEVMGRINSSRHESYPRFPSEKV